jgi:hypothetical protein
MMANLNIPPSEYNDFTKGQGKFSGKKSSHNLGGGGCSGSW